MTRDRIICPGCDDELDGTFCTACESDVSEWSTKTLDQWNAENPEEVNAIRERLNRDFNEFFGLTEIEHLGPGRIAA